MFCARGNDAINITGCFLPPNLQYIDGWKTNKPNKYLGFKRRYTYTLYI